METTMIHHTPSAFEFLSAVMWVVLAVLGTRFALRWFFGVRRIERQIKEQARVLAEVVKQLNVEIPAPVAPSGLKGRLSALAQAIRVLFAHVRLR
jgi:hypothetical protein